MSHFVVLIVGDDPEQQLEPFQEGGAESIADKWDWYAIGGRWTGYFKVKQQPKYPSDVGIGEPGIMTERARDGRADRLRKCDIDVEAMQDDARRKANEMYDKVETATKDCPPAKTWDQILAECDEKIDRARQTYGEQPYVAALRAAKLDPFISCGVKIYGVGREAFVGKAMRTVLTPFAVLMDGKWLEKGEMGWFGAVRNEAPGETWDIEFHKLFESLPSDTLLTIVDCHI